MHYRQIYESAFGKIPKDDHGRSYEIHHKDGDHSNNSLDNLICISIEEHYIIHLLQGDFHAANLVAQRIKNPELTLRGYKFAHSESTKQKMRKPKSNTENYKKPKSAEHANNIRLARLGIPRPDVAAANMIHKKGIVPAHNYETCVCPHCQKEGQSMALKRWHFDNCKYKGAN